uniref:Secreted protein n=1 Tax=Trichogramma kaykai TaxID=54128 RepID=A0ABD2XKQ6_9HYME
MLRRSGIHSSTSHCTWLCIQIDSTTTTTTTAAAAAVAASRNLVFMRYIAAAASWVPKAQRKLACVYVSYLLSFAENFIRHSDTSNRELNKKEKKNWSSR